MASHIKQSHTARLVLTG